MSEQQFEIIFRGDIVLGFQLADVKTRLQHLFKVDAGRIEALFTGKPVALKRGLDQISAQKYKEILMKAGAQVSVVAMQFAETEVVAARKLPVNTGDNLSARIQSTSSLVESNRASVSQTPASAASSNGAQTHGLSLAPAGENLASPVQKRDIGLQEIDISHLQLREQAGNILDATELHVKPTAQVSIPDLQLAALGENLLREEEKDAPPSIDIHVDNWTLAATGENLVADTERPTKPIKPISIPDIQVAPAGSDLGQLKSTVSHRVPDTSSLHLID